MDSKGISKQRNRKKKVNKAKVNVTMREKMIAKKAKKK